MTMGRTFGTVWPWAMVLGFLMIATTGCPTLSGVVIFKDVNLEKAIRSELGQPFGLLTQEVLLQLETLDAKGRGIRDLTGIEYCENLTWLDLDSNQISDITPLKNLVNLMVLNLDSNQIFDISPLGGLLFLDSLSLFDNQVGDIQWLVTNAQNGGLGPGDFVILDARHLSARALTVDVPTLQALGVDVILVEPAS